MADLQLQALKDRSETYQFTFGEDTATLSLRSGKFSVQLHGEEIFSCFTRSGNSFKDSERNRYLIMAVTAILLYRGIEYRIEELMKCVVYRSPAIVAKAS